MFSDSSIDSKKDKRMLVLLAFGCLIILFRLCVVFIGDDHINKKWDWSGEAGQRTGLYRWTLETTNGGNQISLVRDPGSKNNFSVGKDKKISHRAAFLLGRPFPVNSGGIDELEMLPGIGPILAKSIVEYRDRYGLITDRNALMKVPGIGPKLSAKLIPLITFEENDQ